MEEEHDLAASRQMSGDGSESGQGTTSIIDDEHAALLPAYFVYLSLGFKIISTVIIIVMASCVFITINITRSLHKTHNIFVAHLMILDIMQV